MAPTRSVRAILEHPGFRLQRKQQAEVLKRWPATLASLHQRGKDQVSVDNHEGDGDEREGWQRTLEQEARGYGEERGEADAEQGRPVAEIQETARCGEKGQKYEVAHAEAKTQRRAERREDEQQAVEYGRVLLHEHSGWSCEDAEEVRGYRGEDDDQDHADGGYVAGERDADASSR